MRDKYGIAISLYHLGDTALRLEEFTAAESYLIQSLAMTQEMSERPIIVITLIALAELYRKTGRKKEALEFLQDGLALAREIQAFPSVARILLEYVEFAMGDQNWEIATEIARYVIQVYPQDADNKKMAGDLLARLNKNLAQEKIQPSINIGKKHGYEAEDVFLNKLLK